MRNRYLITSSDVIFLTGLLVSITQAGNWQEFAVRPTTDESRPSKTGRDEQEAPDIYSNIIVWQQFVYEYGDYDIYIVDMNNPTDPLVLIIGDSNDQTNPAVYENIVVWQDDRPRVFLSKTRAGGNSEIYAMVLDGPEVARCTFRIAGDVNGDCKIDFEDFAVMASHWLECYLEPAEACW